MRRVRLLLAGVLVASSLAGCVTLPETKTGQASAWTPASKKNTTRFFANYDAINKKATARRDIELMESIQSGPLLRTTQAAFRIAERLDPEGNDPAPVPVHRDIRTYVPHFRDYPIWYVAVSRLEGDGATDDGGTAVDLVMRPNAAVPWRKAQTVVLDERAVIPELAEKNGHAVVVEGDDGEGLALSPAQVAGWYAAMLEAGPSSPHARAFAPHPDTRRSHEASAQNKQESGYEQSFEVVSVRALATADGGALVLFTLEESEQLSLRNGELELSSDDAVAAYTGHAKGRDLLRTSWIWQVVAVVPPEGAEDQLVHLLGVDRALASAELR
ncbi:MAG TPA: hypothetical protein VIL34_07790 [Actinopolymorphaceae bacterium]